jgi:hypothetical protein
VCYNASFKSLIVQFIYSSNLNLICNKVATCLILHNMCVSDRVMGDVNATYNPSFRIGEEIEEIEETVVHQPAGRLAGSTTPEEEW